MKVQTTKILKTCHKFIGDKCIWERISLMNGRWISHLVFHQVLNAVSDGLFKKMFNGEIIFYSKGILKRLFYSMNISMIITSKRLHTNHCQIHGWKFLYFCIIHKTIFWGIQIQNYRARKQLCDNTLKRDEFIFL